VSAAIVVRRRAAGGLALSNPTGLTLRWIAEFGNQARRGLICTLAASRWQAHILGNRSSGWVGPAGCDDLERASGNSVGDSGRRTSPGRRPVSCEGFERLCHVAINFQI
jgi:hypothetical protein